MANFQQSCYIHSLVPLADKTHKDRRFTLYLLSRKVFCLKKCLFFFSFTPPNVLDMSTESAVHPLMSHLDVDLIKGSISQPRSLGSFLLTFILAVFIHVKSLLNPSWSFVKRWCPPVNVILGSWISKI